MRRLKEFKIELKTSSGFPVLVVGTITPEDPGVGVFNPVIEDFDVQTRRGGSIKFLGITKEEISHLKDKFVENLND